jgi:hypothetical protein
MHVNVFLYPEQTYHVPTRKFFENEVFKSLQNRDVPVAEVAGRCCVLFFRDYAKGAPMGVLPHTGGLPLTHAHARMLGMPADYAAEDVYVCESRYRDNGREIVPIKSWSNCVPPELVAKGKLHPPLTLYVCATRTECVASPLPRLTWSV